MPDQAAAPGALNDDPRAAEILDIVAKETGIERERLTPDATIEELGIASLDIVQSIFVIEERFDVEIPVVSDREGSAEFVTLGDLMRHVLATIDGRRKAGAPG